MTINGYRLPQLLHNHYQPVTTSCSHATGGYESMECWRHPESLTATELHSLVSKLRCHVNRLLIQQPFNPWMKHESHGIMMDQAPTGTKLNCDSEGFKPAPFPRESDQAQDAFGWSALLHGCRNNCHSQVEMLLGDAARECSLGVCVCWWCWCWWFWFWWLLSLS